MLTQLTPIAFSRLNDVSGLPTAPPHRLPALFTKAHTTRDALTPDPTTASVSVQFAELKVNQFEWHNYHYAPLKKDGPVLYYSWTLAIQSNAMQYRVSVSLFPVGMGLRRCAFSEGWETKPTDRPPHTHLVR